MALKSNRLTQKFSRAGMVAPAIIIGFVALLLLGVGGYFYFTSGEAGDEIAPIMAKVTRGEFVSQVLDQGEIQSSENVEIRCEVRARNGQLNVLSVVPEGTSVKAGDFLVQLDSTSFEKELEQQNIAMANAQTAVIQAETTLESAKATLREYEEGIFIQNETQILSEINKAVSDITTADQNLEQAIAVYNHSKKLQARGFTTSQTLESDRFNVTRNELAKEAGVIAKKLAEQKLRVLREITKEKELVQLRADIRSAEVRLASERKAFTVETEKLAEIKEMIERCEIVVPPGVSGQVVYAKESSRGGNDWVLEEGTTVRENQVLVRLPNPDKMEVKALINEQSITQITPNMPATIKVDALNNTTLKGIVTKVNQYAESSGWMSSSIRKYAVFVRILNPPPTLKPGMNSSVSIQVQYEPDVLLAPIQTVYAVQDKQFCLARRGEQWVTIPVEVGGDNSQMVYIKSGVEEGDELVMNPGAYKKYMDLPEIELDKRIELPEGTMAEIGKTSSESGVKPGKGEVARGGNPDGGRPGGGAPGGGGGPGGGGFNASAMIDGMFSRYDTNGDGKIDAEETAALSERAKPMVSAADSDGDGSVTKEELTAGMQKMMQSRGGGGGGRPGGGGGR